MAQGIARRANGQQFLGDLPSIYLRLSSEADCEPGQHVDSELMRELASAVDARINR